MADFTGDGGANSVFGGGADESFDYSQGGADTVWGGGGDDTIYFGAAFAAGDQVNGQAGNDVLELEGDYSGGVVFDGVNVVGVETIHFLNFSAPRLRVADGIVDTDATLTVINDDVVDRFVLDGRSLVHTALAVTTGGTVDQHVYGGALGDTLTVLHGIDRSDTYDLGGGYDILYAQGIFGRMAGHTFRNIEEIHFAANASVTFNDGNVAAGQTMQVNVQTSDVMLDGSALTTGALRFSVFGEGARLYGTANNDIFNLWAGVFTPTRDAIYDGGAGDDSLGFLGAVDIKAAGHTFRNIEHMSTASDLSLVLADGNISAGATLTFYESAAAGSKIFLDDHKETDGHLTATGDLADDQFIAGALADTLTGGGGDDSLQGGHGGDALSGGLGSDTFVYRNVLDSVRGAVDLISDLDDSDFIDLSRVDADKALGGVQHFTLVEAFGGHAGELVLFYDARRDVTHLRGDVDGDGHADLSIDIAGDHGDFTGLVLDPSS